MRANDRRANCPICEGMSNVAYRERIYEHLIGEYTFASRKKPELMHYTYHKCDVCKLLFVADKPNQSDLHAAYRDASFDAATESTFAAASYFSALRSAFNIGFSSVLDVGCGDGEFLRLCLGEGAERLAGIEPSMAAARGAAENVSPFIWVCCRRRLNPGHFRRANSERFS